MKESDIKHLLPILQAMENSFKIELNKKFKEEQVINFIEKTNKYFIENIKNIPEVGGDNPWLGSLLGVAWQCGLWLELENAGYCPQEISDMVQEILYNFTKSNIPEENYLKVQQMRCSKKYTDEIAKRSQMRVFKDDWIVETVEPHEGDDFKIGFNVYQCPVVTYLRKQNLERFAPYFCLSDYPMHKALGIKLERKHTIANKDTLCDFRLSLF